MVLERALNSDCWVFAYDEASPLPGFELCAETSALRPSHILRSEATVVSGMTCGHVAKCTKCSNCAGFDSPASRVLA